jgi:hypothetical protein
MRQLLFANLARRVLSASSGGESFSFPALAAGDSLAISLRFLQTLGSAEAVEVFPKVRAVRASLGQVDARPERGQFAIKVGTGTTSVGVNATAPLAFNATAAQIKTALNALTGATQDFDTSADNGSYIIRRLGGEQVTLSVVNNTLAPVSFGRVLAYQVDGEWLHELRLIQAPLAQTDSFQRVLPMAPSVSVVQEGYTDPGDSYRIPEIQKLTLPSDFRGTYQLRFDSVYRTAVLDPTDGPFEIQAALNEMLAQIGEERAVVVTNPTSGEALIRFTGDNFDGINVPTLEVIVTSAPPGDPTVELSLDTSEVYAALRRAPQIEGLPLELEMDILDETATSDADLSAPFATFKIRSQITLRNSIFFPGLAAAQNTDWLQKPSPKDYVPFTPSQIITGLQSYTATFGNGSATAYNFSHNLGTAALHVTVRENGGTNLRVPDNTYTTSFPTANTATLTFGTAVASNSLAATFTAAGPASVFQSHTHTIAQIVDLQALLEALGQRVGTLETLVGVNGAGGSASSVLSSTLSLPPLADVYPPARIRGTGEATRTIFAPLPRAIYFGTAALSLGTATELPEANTQSGFVYQLSDTQAYMPARSPRRGRLITSADAPFVMSDGYEWWPAERKVTGSNVFYPVEMNRTLWELAITPEMLAPGRKLRVNWSVLLAMLAERPELRGVYTLRVRKGTLTGETNFGTANNIEAVTWDQSGGVEQPLFEQRISLTRSGVIHPFDLEIDRSTAGVLSAKRTVYGKTVSAPAPQNTQFILRAELSRFDLENYTNAMGRPVGQVYLQTGKADNAAASDIKARFPLDTGGEESSDAAKLLFLAATIT